MLTPEEKQSYDENGFILKKALASPEEIEKIREDIEDIHNRMAEQPVEGVGPSWEEFDDPALPPRLKQWRNNRSRGLVPRGKNSMTLPYPHVLSS